MMKVFMTGANGFVGLNIVKALKEEEHQVRAYVRATSDIQFLKPFDVEIVNGELSDIDALTEAMKGCDAVIHTAGNTSCYERDYPTLKEVNVDGTKNVVDAAVKNGIKRLVFSSTTSTVGAKDSHNEKSTEKTELTGFRAKSPYARTKQQAEKIICKAVIKDGLEGIILNMAEVIGPFDHNMQWGRLVLAVNYDQVPFLPPGGASFCSASEAGRMHVKALTKGKPGERYLIGGVDHAYKNFLDTISELVDKPYSLPDKNYMWLYTKAIMQEKFPWLVSGAPTVEASRMRIFLGHYYFDSSKAVNDLDYDIRSLPEMLGECVDWYRDNGFIR